MYRAGRKAHTLQQTKWMGPVVVPRALVGLFVVSLLVGGLQVYPQHSFWHQPVPRGEKTRRMLPLWGFGKTEI